MNILSLNLCCLRHQTPKRVEVHSIHTYVALYKFLPQEKDDLELQSVWFIFILCVCVYENKKVREEEVCTWSKFYWHSQTICLLSRMIVGVCGAWVERREHAGRPGRTNSCEYVTGRIKKKKESLYASRCRKLLSVVWHPPVIWRICLCKKTWGTWRERTSPFRKGRNNSNTTVMCVRKMHLNIEAATTYISWAYRLEAAWTPYIKLHNKLLVVSGFCP